MFQHFGRANVPMRPKPGASPRQEETGSLQEVSECRTQGSDPDDQFSLARGGHVHSYGHEDFSDALFPGDFFLQWMHFFFQAV